MILVQDLSGDVAISSFGTYYSEAHFIAHAAHLFHENKVKLSSWQAGVAAIKASNGWVTSEFSIPYVARHEFRCDKFIPGSLYPCNCKCAGLTFSPFPQVGHKLGCASWQGLGCSCQNLGLQSGSAFVLATHQAMNRAMNQSSGAPEVAMGNFKDPIHFCKKAQDPLWREGEFWSYCKVCGDWMDVFTGEKDDDEDDTIPF